MNVDSAARRIRWFMLWFMRWFMRMMRGCVAGLCFAACCGYGLPGISTAHAASNDTALDDRIQSAGRGAHLGRELCRYTPTAVADYKERLRHSLSAPAEFDTQWDYGWKRAEPILLQYQSLRASDPQDYESRVRMICATLHSMAKRLPKQPKKDAPQSP